MRRQSKVRMANSFVVARKNFVPRMRGTQKTALRVRSTDMGNHVFHAGVTFLQCIGYNSYV